MLYCNWCSSKSLVYLWNKMQGLEDIELVDKDLEVDFYCVINAVPSHVKLTPEQKKRTVVFRMEPYMNLHPELWGEYADPKDDDFLYVVRHGEKSEFDSGMNNIEWHISLTRQQLETSSFNKTELLSTVLSDKYRDPGHVKRVDFVKHLDRRNIPIDVYGSNKWDYKNYKGDLPYHQKDRAILPYKYTFNAENHSIFGYVTEKLIDGILGECLVFYSGCYNVKEYIDERAFVYLDLNDLEKDSETVKRAITEDWWSKRRPYILEAKRKILRDLTFFNRLERILRSLRDLRSRTLKNFNI